MRVKDIFVDEYGFMRFGWIIFSALAGVALFFFVMIGSVHYINKPALRAEHAQLQSDICSVENNEVLIERALRWNLDRAANIEYAKFPVISWVITDEMTSGLPPIDLTCGAEGDNDNGQD